jgi:TatD DNase family protein
MLQHDTCQYPYVDLHAHLQFDDFNQDRDVILQEMRDKNVIAIQIGTTVDTSVAGVSLASKNKDICYATIGLHPVYADEGGEQEITRFSNTLIEHINTTQVVGIGECGMDFFRVEKREQGDTSLGETNPDFSFQEKVFEHQIQMAKEHNLPLMLHVRDSYQKTLSILSKYFNSTKVEYRGNAHFFVGSIEEAQAFLDLGFSISFTGVITFVPAYEELVRYVPLERMFAETDSPYVSPVPYRGKKNTPIHVIEIYKKISEIKGVPLEVVRETLYKNACKFWLKDRNIDNPLS